MGPEGPQFKSGRPDLYEKTMKKFFSPFLALICLVFVQKIFPASVDIPGITIQNPASQQTIDVNVNFSSEKKFAGYQFTVQYNQEILKLLDVYKGSAVSSFTMMTNTGIPGTIKIAGFDPGLSGISGSGILATLRFQIISQGYSNLILSSVKLSDTSGQSIPCSTSSGYIKAGEAQKPQPKSENPVSVEPEKKSSTPSAITPQVQPKPIPTPPVPEPTQPRVKQPPLETIDIDQFLSMETELLLSSTEKQEKTTLLSKPVNTVTLLVFSEYGKPTPPTGITTFTKGDRVNCYVESDILISDTEKVVCTGCEGKGSAFNTSKNSISFVIEKDSKIVWKWKKIPVEPGILIESQNQVVFEPVKKEINIPVKIRFLGGFNNNVLLKAETAPFDIVLSETELSPEKKETILTLKKNNQISAGNYPISIIAESKDKKLKTKKDISILVYANISAGEAVIDETKKTVRIPLITNGKLENISSFEFYLTINDDIKFLKIEPCQSDIKIFSGITQKGKTLKISGGLVPPLKTDKNLLDIVFSFSKEFKKDSIGVNKVSLWNEDGNPLPIFYQIK